MLREKKRVYDAQGTGSTLRKSLVKVVSVVLLVVFLGGLGAQWYNLEKIEDMVKADCTPPNWPTPLPQKNAVIYKNAYTSIPTPNPEVTGLWHTEVRYSELVAFGITEYSLEFRVVRLRTGFPNEEIANSTFYWTNRIEEGNESIPLCNWAVSVETNPNYEAMGYGRYIAHLGYGEMFLRGHVTPQSYFRSVDINWSPDRSSFAQVVIPEAFYAYGGRLVSSLPPLMPGEVLPPNFQELDWYPTSGPWYDASTDN